MKKAALLLGLSAIVFVTAVAQDRLRDRRANRLKPHDITVDEIERTYRLVVPPGADQPMPLVLVLHGGGFGDSGARHVIGYTKFHELALREKFIVVYPMAVDGNWNDGRGVDFIRAQRENIDDVKFIREVVSQVAKDHPVDLTRVFSAGISNGAFMSHRLAAEAADLVAGVAPVVGGMSHAVSDAFDPSHPVSLFVIQGDTDPLISIEGGEVGLPKRRKRGKAPATAATVGKYLTAYGIDGKPTVSTLPDRDPEDGTTTETRVYPDAPNGAKVQLYVVKGGGHTWPGAKRYLTEKLVGKTSRDFGATKAIWEFFKSCPPRKPEE